MLIGEIRADSRVGLDLRVDNMKQGIKINDKLIVECK